MLIAKGSRESAENYEENENNLRLNHELFSLEMSNLTDLSRFLNWEVSHL